LLAAAAGSLVRAPNGDTGHPTKTYFSQCAHWTGQWAHWIFSVLTGLFSVHTGYPVCLLAYPVCTLGRKSARFQCANWARLPVYTLDIQCAHWTSNVYTGICVLAGCNIYTGDHVLVLFVQILLLNLVYMLLRTRLRFQ
jgi:hypothetical protein